MCRALTGRAVTGDAGAAGTPCGRRLLLHACCGPCSLEPTRLLSQEGWDITICYVNPNIAPRAEYLRRLDTLARWARGEGIAVIEGPYEPLDWEREVARFGTNRLARCEACYRMRLCVAADIGAREGFDALATTLAISPYQLLDACNRELVGEAGRCGLEPLPRDFRSHYPQATTRSRELGHVSPELLRVPLLGRRVGLGALRGARGPPPQARRRACGEGRGRRLWVGRPCAQGGLGVIPAQSRHSRGELACERLHLMRLRLPRRRALS